MAFPQQPISYKVVVEPYKLPEGAYPFAGVPKARAMQVEPRSTVRNESLPQPEPLVKKQVRSTGSLPRPDFNPYTRMDASGAFTRSNGLGAFMIGSEEWLRKKEQRERRQAYARQVLVSNHDLLRHQHPRRDSLSPQPLSTRQRAIEFARGIKKPKAEKKKAVTSAQRDLAPDPLDQLEARHLQLRGRVETLKAYLL